MPKKKKKKEEEEKKREGGSKLICTLKKRRKNAPGGGANKLILPILRYILPYQKRLDILLCKKRMEKSSILSSVCMVP